MRACPRRTITGVPATYLQHSDEEWLRKLLDELEK